MAQQIHHLHTVTIYNSVPGKTALQYRFAALPTIQRNPTGNIASYIAKKKTESMKWPITSKGGHKYTTTNTWTQPIRRVNYSIMNPSHSARRGCAILWTADSEGNTPLERTWNSQLTNPSLSQPLIRPANELAGHVMPMKEGEALSLGHVGQHIQLTKPVTKACDPTLGTL